MQIGFIGLGNMGAPIAANLLRAGHDVAVWNRTRTRAKALLDAGAAWAPTPKAAATGRAAVFTMLADDGALDAVVTGENGLAAGLGATTPHVSMSTISVDTADRIAAAHRVLGQRFLCAPVFGRPAAAAGAKLFVVAAGESEDFKTVNPLFEAVAQRVFYVGPSPSAANLIKLCGNFMVLSAIEALSEAMTLAEKGGVPKLQLLEVLTGSLFDCPLYRTYGEIVSEERFRPAGFAAPLGLKDMRLVGQSADSLRVPMPLLSVLRDHLLQTIAQEGEDVDWSAIAQSIKKNAGL